MDKKKTAHSCTFDAGELVNTPIPTWVISLCFGDFGCLLPVLTETSTGSPVGSKQLPRRSRHGSCPFLSPHEERGCRRPGGALFATAPSRRWLKLSSAKTNKCEPGRIRVRRLQVFPGFLPSRPSSSFRLAGICEARRREADGRAIPGNENGDTPVLRKRTPVMRPAKKPRHADPTLTSPPDFWIRSRPGTIPSWA